MKRTILRCAAGLLMVAALLPTALAAEPFPTVPEVQVCYPTSVTRSEDGTEIRKVYDLSPAQDPAGIPRSDFEQDGFQLKTVEEMALERTQSRAEEDNPESPVPVPPSAESHLNGFNTDQMLKQLGNLNPQQFMSGSQGGGNDGK